MRGAPCSPQHLLTAAPSPSQPPWLTPQRFAVPSPCPDPASSSSSLTLPGSPTQMKRPAAAAIPRANTACAGREPRAGHVPWHEAPGNPFGSHSCHAGSLLSPCRAPFQAPQAPSEQGQRSWGDTVMFSRPFCSAAAWDHPGSIPDGESRPGGTSWSCRKPRDLGEESRQRVQGAPFDMGGTRRMLCDVQCVPVHHDGAIRLVHLERGSSRVRPKGVVEVLLQLQTQLLPQEVSERCQQLSGCVAGPSPCHQSPHREHALPVS